MPPVGFEPTTNRLKVYCATSCATEAHPPIITGGTRCCQVTRCPAGDCPSWATTFPLPGRRIAWTIRSSPQAPCRRLHRSDRRWASRHAQGQREVPASESPAPSRPSGAGSDPGTTRDAGPPPGSGLPTPLPGSAWPSSWRGGSRP